MAMAPDDDSPPDHVRLAVADDPAHIEWIGAGSFVGTVAAFREWVESMIETAIDTLDAHERTVWGSVEWRAIGTDTVYGRASVAGDVACSVQFTPVMVNDIDIAHHAALDPDLAGRVVESVMERLEDDAAAAEWLSRLITVVKTERIRRFGVGVKS